MLNHSQPMKEEGLTDPLPAKSSLKTFTLVRKNDLIKSLLPRKPRFSLGDFMLGILKKYLFCSKRLVTLLCGFSLSLSGCSPLTGIENASLKERVVACSGGFSEDASLSLVDTLDKTNLSGNISGDFKNHAQSIIFSEVAEKDRLSAYRDYLKCVEEKWNTPQIHHLNTKIKTKRLLATKKHPKK